MIMYQANIILSIECILYSNGFHNSQRVFIIHPNDENLFERKQRYDIILSIECILSFSNGFHNSQRVFIIQTRIFSKESRDTINYVSGEYNSVHRMYSVFEWILYFAACLHNPSKLRQSFRLKESKEGEI